MSKIECEILIFCGLDTDQEIKLHVVKMLETIESFLFKKKKNIKNKQAKM